MSILSTVPTTVGGTEQGLNKHLLPDCGWKSHDSMERAQRLVNRDYGVIKVASGSISTVFLFFLSSPNSYSQLFSFPSCSSPVFSLASVHHGHYLILLMALEGREVPMTTSDLVPLSLPLKL